MKPRRLKLESGVWRFVVRKTKTTLWSVSGKKHSIWNHEIAGYGKYAAGHIPDTKWCGDPWCCSPISNPVTPGNLRQYIEANLLD
jgi:hypothetical protein